MADKKVEQTDDQAEARAPWWAGFGKRGAVILIVLGGVAAAWIFLAPAAGLPSLPLVPDEPAAGYYQAAKVVAIGLVILGTALLGRRGRTAGAGERESRTSLDGTDAAVRPAPRPAERRA